MPVDVRKKCTKKQDFGSDEQNNFAWRPAAMERANGHF
jgi:hypothetical protein